MNHGYCKNCEWYNKYYDSEQDKWIYKKGYCGMWNNEIRPYAWCPDYNPNKVKIRELCL